MSGQYAGRVARTRLLLFALLLVGAATATAKDKKPESLPEGAGLSKRYKGDKGISRHKAVLLAESFEDGEIKDLHKRWSEVKNEVVAAEPAPDPLREPRRR